MVWFLFVLLFAPIQKLRWFILHQPMGRNFEKEDKKISSDIYREEDGRTENEHCNLDISLQ